MKTKKQKQNFDFSGEIFNPNQLFSKQTQTNKQNNKKKKKKKKQNKIQKSISQIHHGFSPHSRFALELYSGF